jgi:hypothetical protein
MTDLQFFREGAATIGACEERDCGGVMRVVEDMGSYTWAQCQRCHVQTGIGKGATRPAERDSGPAAADHSGDAFLGAT